LPSSLDGANTPSRIQHNGTTRRTTRTTPHSGLRLRLGKGDGLQLTPKLRAPDRETKPGESPVLVSQPPTRLTPDGMAKWVTGASNARHPPRRISTSSAPPSRASWSTSARPAEAADTPGTRKWPPSCLPRRRRAYPESQVRRCHPILEPHRCARGRRRCAAAVVGQRSKQREQQSSLDVVPTGLMPVTRTATGAAPAPPRSGPVRPRRCPPRLGMLRRLRFAARTR